MAFGTLDRSGLAAFLENEAFDRELCVFIHIPKTAGSSFSTELSKLRAPYHNIHRRYFGEDVVTFSRIEDEIASIAADTAFATAGSCSGHFSWLQAQPIRDARPDARFVTFLRDPVQRVISDYRYARTPAHPTYRQFITRYPDIETYVAARESQDKMARFVLTPDDRTREEIEAALDLRYAFVGILELYAMSFNILSRLLGKNQLPVEHKRKTEQTKDNDVTETEALHRLIAAHNPRDTMLYGIVHDRLSAICGDWANMPTAAAAT